MNTVVIGSGVIGLTTGIRLLEAGHRVTIIARDLPPHTTSDVAAAVWFPYRARPLDRVLAWSRASLDVYYQLAENPATGVALTTFVDLFTEPAPDPWWRGAVRCFWRPSPEALPAGYVDGHAAEVALVETPVFMAWLAGRFRALGGVVEQRTVAGLGEARGGARLVVNCAGLGARELAGDARVHPVRGQIVRVRRPPGVTTAYFDEHGPHALAYVIPRRDDVIVGGTAEVDDWNTAVDSRTAEIILAKGARLVPALAGAEVLAHRVGLRPGRDAVRLESEDTADGRVIHNYGHGGAGFTLAWGCADEVVALAGDLVRSGH